MPLVHANCTLHPPLLLFALRFVLRRLGALCVESELSCLLEDDDDFSSGWGGFLSISYRSDLLVVVRMEGDEALNSQTYPPSFQSVSCLCVFKVSALAICIMLWLSACVSQEKKKRDWKEERKRSRGVWLIGGAGRNTPCERFWCFFFRGGESEGKEFNIDGFPCLSCLFSFFWNAATAAAAGVVFIFCLVLYINIVYYYNYRCRERKKGFH